MSSIIEYLLLLIIASVAVSLGIAMDIIMATVWIAMIFIPLLLSLSLMGYSVLPYIDKSQYANPSAFKVSVITSVVWILVSWFLIVPRLVGNLRAIGDAVVGVL